MGFEKFASCSVRDFQLKDELFRGSTGSVWRATFKYDNKDYVLKQNKLDSGTRSRKNANNEVALLLQLSHVNCIKCYGHFFDESHNSMYIVLEYCEGGDMNKLIDERKKDSLYFEESEIWNYFLQICLGVQHLHQMGIVHRDLKTLNLLLSQDRTVVKVADLGVSRQMSQETMLLETFYGTPLYLSPEMIDGTQYTEKTDIWSLGVILYELAALRPPFRSPTLLGLAHAIKAGEIGPIPDRYRTRPDGGNSMERCIKWMLQQDYSKRPNITEVIKRVQHHAADSVIRPNPSPQKPRPTSEEANRKKREDKLAASECKSSGAVREEKLGSRERERERERETRPDAPAAAESKPREEAKAQRKTCVRGGVVVDVVQVDHSRLLAAERREKQLLKKLQQTRALSASSISSDFVGADDQQSKSHGHSRAQQPTGNEEDGEQQKLASLEDKIRDSRQRLAMIESALAEKGEMAITDAAR
jgi:serine/threonine protein kinase